MKKNEEVAIDNVIAEGVNVEVHTSLAANTLVTKQSCNTITQDYDTKDLAKTSETELALQLQNSANQNTKKSIRLMPAIDRDCASDSQSAILEHYQTTKYSKFCYIMQFHAKIPKQLQKHY